MRNTVMSMSEEAMTRGETPGTVPRYPAGAPAQYGTADYIMELSGQLSRLAEDAGLDLLCHLLEMVEVEAKRAKKRLRAAGDA